jgi:hypothetical protein
MDLVLGMDFLRKHDVTVHSRKSQIPIAAQPDPVVFRANPKSHTNPKDTEAAIGLLSAAQFALYCKVRAPGEQTFLGYIKQLVAATAPMPVARMDTQPPENKRHKANLREAFKGHSL